MKKSVLKSMMIALGTATAICVLLCAAIFRPQGIQWVILAGVGLASFGAAALVGTRCMGAALEPVRQFMEDVTAVRTQGKAIETDSLPYMELAVIGQEIGLLSANTRALHSRAMWEHGQAHKVLDALTDGVLLLDSELRVIFANAAADEAFGREPQGLMGELLTEASGAAPLAEGAQRAAGTPYPVTAHIALSEHRFGEAAIQRIATTEGGGESGFLIVIHDVTAQHESEAVRRDFFDAASRVLRTPTERIKGLAELLCSDMTLGGNKEEDVSKRLLSESRRLAAIMGKLTLLTRLENGDLVLPRVSFDLALLVQERCTRAEKAAKRLKVALTCKVQPCTYFAARGEIAVLLDELLDNALRFNRTGGRVEITLAVEQDAPCLRIFNTGDILTSEQARRIFERFYHGKNAAGAGLGLAIVRQIVLEYDGALLVTPAPDGNLFSVRFPKAAGA